MSGPIPQRRYDPGRDADVAQLVEHFTRNEGVRGSSPRVGFNDRDLLLADLLKTQHIAVGLEGVDPRRIASGDRRRMLLRAHLVAPFVACGERVWSTPRA
jgi:hypothetical protein